MSMFNLPFQEIIFHIQFQEVTIPKGEVLDCNPSKFEKEEDMSNLSILNKACILHNLRTR